MQASDSQERWHSAKWRTKRENHLIYAVNTVGKNSIFSQPNLPASVSTRSLERVRNADFKSSTLSSTVIVHGDH